MKVDLKSMNRKELEKLQADVKKALLNVQSKERREARKAAEKAAAKFGFSLNELTAGAKPGPKPKKAKQKKTGPKAAPKYANPADKAQTWTGKGRQPNWYRAEVAKGTVPVTMEI